MFVCARSLKEEVHSDEWRKWLHTHHRSLQLLSDTAQTTQPKQVETVPSRCDQKCQVPSAQTHIVDFFQICCHAVASRSKSFVSSYGADARGKALGLDMCIIISCVEFVSSEHPGTFLVPLLAYLILAFLTFYPRPFQLWYITRGFLR